MIKHCRWFLMAATLAAGCAGRDDFAARMRQRGELVVLCDADTVDYFMPRAVHASHTHALLQDYADARGVALRMVGTHDDTTQIDMVLGGAADGFRKVSLRRTAYLVLERRGGTGNTVLTTPSFADSRYCKHITDNLLGGAHHVAHADRALADSIAAGRYGYLVCRSDELDDARTSAGTYRIVYRFTAPLSPTLALAGDNGELAEDFASWLGQHRAGARRARLGIVRISQYDALMRRVGAREGIDWRLLAAIAYEESRFATHARSASGARGIMQIMPATARQFDVPHEEMTDAEVNVTLAAQLIRRIGRSLRLPVSIAHDDGMGIILASYNCGIGHVSDARRLAAKYGADPDSWRDVSRFLLLKADPAYHDDEVVRNGPFSGGRRASAFVRRVMAQWANYRLVTNP